MTHTGPLIVTTSWDDGHPLDLRLAALLDRHGVQATFYVPRYNSEGRPVMTAGEIAEVGRRFEIGGHTQNHVVLIGMDWAHAAEEIGANKRWLEDLLGREIPGFAYVRGRHDRRLRQCVERAGFRYARTVTNLANCPGLDRFQVPTTAQFFPHSTSVYVRNFFRAAPSLARVKTLAAILRDGDFVGGLVSACAVGARTGGHFHLWGHSWELDEHDLWGDLECFLIRLRELNARFVANAAWCGNLLTPGADDLRARPGLFGARGEPA